MGERMRIWSVLVLTVLVFSLTLGVCLAQTSEVTVSQSEMEIIKARFKGAGWKTDTHTTSFHNLLVVSAGEELHYIFRFEKWPGGLRGTATRDPNVRSDRYVGGDPMITFFEVPEWREMEPIATNLGFDAETFKNYAPKASRQLPASLSLTSPIVRELTSSERKAILQVIRAGGLVQRTVYDASGERIEELPFDTRVIKAYKYLDLFWVMLNSKVDPIITKYAVILRVTPSGGRPIFQHADDISQLPFDAAFPEIVTIYKGSKGLFPWWNYYDDDQGQVGLWFRKQLQKSGSFRVWSPQEQETILSKLVDKGPKFTGLVYASKNARAIAQFYNASGDLRYAEFIDNELVRTRSLEEAITHLEQTNSSDVWWCYNGVSQQFGHPSLIKCLYKTRHKSGDR